jgi:outer membrane lipoprotein-sorting protein
MRHVSPALLTAFCLAVTGVRAMTADELIAKNIEARGGLERIQAITSIRATGIARLGGGGGIIEQAYTLLQTRSGSLRRERSMQGLTTVTAFDGTAGWTVNPFRGRREPQRLAPDIVKSLAYDADLEGPLVDYRKKGHTVEYMGTEDVDGTEAHKLHLTLKDGTLLDVYLDPDYFLEIREIQRRTVRGVEGETEVDPGNYAKVNGVMMPFSIESGDRGGPKSFRIALTKIEVNVPIDDSVFKFPAGASAAATPGKGGGR